jgi:hypothetical protein
MSSSRKVAYGPLMVPVGVDLLVPISSPNLSINPMTAFSFTLLLFLVYRLIAACKVLESIAGASSY